MMRSLFSGVAGLKTHQTRMDVIGNNIANVNTVAYKSSNATFQELMYQTTANASAANAETGRGGINPKQIGLGTSLGAINTNITAAGASQTTGNATDLQISGDSFFIVSDGSTNYFTRAGAFYIDGAGNLAMTSNGFTVMGWQPNEATKDNPDDVIVNNVSKLQVMAPDNLVSAPERTSRAYLDGVIDKNDPAVSSDDGRLVNISVYDALGYNYIVQASITDYADGDATKTKLGEGMYNIAIKKVLNSDGVDIMHDGTTNLTATIGGAAAAAISFDPKTGQITTPAAPGTLDIQFGAQVAALGSVQEPEDATTGVGAGVVRLDLKTLTMYDNNGTSTVAGHGGTKDGGYKGRKMGKMSGIAIQQDGKIYGSYDNGTTKLLGQIAVANFANPSGLEKVGDNLYSPTQNSGEFDGIGKDITADGAGKMNSGVLEMSNVDLSAEFTDMITTQRGFQANSRIITVSDSMIEELVNLKR